MASSSNVVAAADDPPKATNAVAAKGKDALEEEPQSTTNSGDDNSAGAITTTTSAADSAAVDAGQGATVEGVEEEEIAVYITIHPPPQSDAAPLVLEPLAGVELVMQVRQLLGEIPQTCLYSAFRLVAVIPGEGNGDGGGDGGGKEGVKEDVWKGDGEVMNDYVELRSIGAVVARPERVEVRGMCGWMV